MTDIWMPGVPRVEPTGQAPIPLGLQGKGLRLFTWHTFEADYTYSPDCVAAARYLNSQGSTSHFVFHPVTGALVQLLPMTQGARTLRADGPARHTNAFGSVHAQVEVIARAARPFTADLTDAGRATLARLMDYLRSWGIPDQWAMTPPPAYPGPGTTRGAPTRSGHLGHAHWWANDHGDPGAIADPWTLTANPTEETPVPIAENGWPCIPLSETTTFLAPNGKVVYVNPAGRDILGYVAWRWHMSVEPIAAATNLEGDPAVRQGAIVAIHSWRPAAQIAGSTYYSNHGTALAMDINGHLHPYEHSVLAAGGRYDDGFTDAQVATLRKIKAEVRALAGGADILRLGLDFAVGRRDGMHVELVGTRTQLDRCAAAIRAAGWLVPTRRGDIASYQAAVGTTADDFHGTGTTRVLKLEQAKLGVEPTGRWDVPTRTAWCQTRLKAHGFDAGVVDGLPGPLFDAAVKRFQKAKGLTVDGVPGRLTVAALAKAPVVAAPKLASTPKPAPKPEPASAPAPAPEPTLPPGSRIAGADRYATSAAAYRAAPPELQSTVYLAAGNAVTLADALSAPSDGSVLLVRAGQSILPTPVEAALRDLRPTRVVALGSPDVIPDATVHAALTAAGITTTTK